MASVYEAQLKSAIAAGDFKQAERVFAAYDAELAALFAGPSSRQERAEALENFRNLLSLARVMRAHIGAQLTTLQRQACYRYQTPDAERHAWQFEA